MTTIITAVVVVVTITTGLLAGPEVYTSIAREFPGTPVVIVVAVLRAIHEVFSILTLGALAAVVMFNSRTDGLGWSLPSTTARFLLQVFSAIWASAVLPLTVIDGLNTNGMPLMSLKSPGQLSFALTGTFYPAAWLIVLAAAFIVFAVSLFSESWAAHAVSLWIGMIALLAPVVIAQVLVGPNHDFGEDASIIQTPLSAVVVGLLATSVFLELAHPRCGALRRLARSRLLWIGLAGIACTDAVISVFKLAGTSLTDSTTGWQLFTRWVALAIITLTLLAGATARPGSVRSISARFGVVLGVATWMAMTAAMTLIPSPNYFAPNSTVAVFLGYTVDAAPDPMVLLTHWRINLLLTCLAAAAMFTYSLGVLKLRRRGDSWPAMRTICWMLGWITTIVLMGSGLGKYSPADFGIHMIVHMSLNMLIPALLVGGGPITLLLRSTSGTNRVGHQVRNRVNQLINWPGLRLLLHPLFVFTVYVGSYYVLYLTPLFGDLIRYHWGHQLMNVHFLIVGYMFFSLVVGVDKLPVELPHIGKLGYVIAAMPFHAFFGIVLMMTSTPVGLNFYRTLDLPWLDIPAEQYFAGGIAWAGGELPLLGVVIVLGIQWARQDKRDAQRFDRHEDAGLSDEFSAYNDMLRRLAVKDGAVTVEEGLKNRD
ncbi:MAG: cytochrome c oxidase assembly protein [Brevibacterium sp.]|uniref:cytochrome c oxidase assembly protein n=1 Tax=Brevibacterium sp. TaxID=1701 RepID=UPI0026489A2D|nr:cytochrome c oxidase assembly protein [Brevibacterium sp.]MDN5833233.1 cytochrome c oxidase assembly protein [Brevibacterium sp.]MDN5875855.1 cytochrome c oxidase assembly protein [Brevibacterium sp.]MDN5908194.1 cytochrome c oxidase assembly protein [Brevibacterium sp.]MDN6132826.1 cytochrome c oxidase assembly protein [Brevibacterium sp.]MDN6157162.1 cytochrome c oxidase assembly protein [Brevibacterium sp.]